jgi:P-type E1-E2 ATPase
VADSRKTVTVLRNRGYVDLHQDQLLVGDIVRLTEGMEVPADGLIYEANEIFCDESAMTG